MDGCRRRRERKRESASMGKRGEVKQGEGEGKKQRSDRARPSEISEANKKNTGVSPSA